MEPIESVYDDRSATVPSAVSWLNAIDEPKLIDINRTEKMVVARTAFTGTFRFKWTWGISQTVKMRRRCSDLLSRRRGEREHLGRERTTTAGGKPWSYS